MKQYLKLLEQIQHKGTLKTPARENMPSTLSLFGYQFRHDLKDGFPLLTTKELSFKNIAVELLWFLNGDTNIKYLIDNGCNIWNEDAYNYYKKVLEKQGMYPMRFEDFIDALKSNVPLSQLESVHSGVPINYKMGDCGFQYGKLWRDWDGVDQIADLFDGLRNNPTSRRHIITAWNPKTLDDMALNACHCLVQFNCRPLTHLERAYYAVNNAILHRNELMFPDEYENKTLDEQLDEANVPKYCLDYQMYQRSADVFLGVPYNIASYALLTIISAKMVNMVPGEFIHTFGDVHIYDNHMDQVKEQLEREPKPLPYLSLGNGFDSLIEDFKDGFITLDDCISQLQPDLFNIKGYDPHPRIKAKLSTGLK